MAEEAKQMISEKQLKTIQELTSKQNELVLGLGSHEVQKNSILEQFKVNDELIVKFKKELEDEFGQVQVDLKTGEISEIPEDDKK
ncbi:MAG: hypothetical protein GY870_22750 [archaeon]|jgi:hypothetical protein|nr:hypothetical protein [archaeon]|tara:strand:- start:1379 stop:1633 length:255 start_codon:yes stop_codon:yes gene_type:complete